jgi:hypothetical protein
MHLLFASKVATIASVTPEWPIHRRIVRTDELPIDDFCDQVAVTWLASGRVGWGEEPGSVEGGDLAKLLLN